MEFRQDRTVYIVEDDDAVRDSLRILLESCDMQVRDFSSARAFLAAVNLNCSEIRDSGCLLLDLHMPDMNGLELLETIRGQGGAMAVVLMTGRPDSALLQRAERNSALALLHKPVEADELVETIERAFDSYAGHC